MNDSRTKNTIRNIRAGIIYQCISIILPFINRTVILYTLGVEFTGLAGLFTSILQVLNIAELGFNIAVVRSLYEPFAKNDIKKINEIVSLFRKIYYIIGTIIFVLGLAILPLIPYLINGTYPNTINIYIIYFMYLINSVLSYFLFAYKESILLADQRKDIADNIRSIINILRYGIQFILLLLFKNFYLYLIVSITGTIATNVTIEICTKNKYPQFRVSHSKIEIPKRLKLEIRGLMINRICDTFRNSFDSLIISSFIGLDALTIYGNYYYIYSALYGIMLVICNAMQASVGNSIVKKSENDNFNDLLKFSQIFAIILGICSTCLLCLYQPFMNIWVGKKLLLPFLDVILFTLYFYLINMNNIRNQYISGTGIWDQLKISYIIEAFGNLSLNIILGKIFGITGVLLATIITIFFFNYLQRNKVLFNNYFKNSKKEQFYKEQFYYLFLTILSCIISYYLCSLLNDNNYMKLFINGTIALFISSIIIISGMSFTKRFKSTKIFINMIIKEKMLKR